LITFYVPGQPVPFARAGSHGKVRFTPEKQENAMGVIKLFAQRAMEGQALLDGPLMVQLLAVYLAPKNWAKKKRLSDVEVYRTSRPDIDNLIKLCLDSLNQIVWIDDAQVARIEAQKIYGPISGLTVTVTPLN
jgi:Holliday junction resolvase RusA-like endonuclease